MKDSEKHSFYYPAALTIAGSDSGGGAGIQTDLRTFSAFGVYGCSAITAVTAQNPYGVAGISAVDPEIVSLQISQVFKAFSVRAVKTGMLFSEKIISRTAEALQQYAPEIPLVVDPVMISTSGSRLLQEDAVEALMKKLLPIASWITPNRFEAEILAGIPVRSFDDMKKAAEICRGKYGCGMIVKGGHFAGKDAQDLVVSENLNMILSSPRLEIPELATHGTGCTFSSALAANLALGLPEKTALENAKKFIFDSLRCRVNPGRDLWAMYPEKFVRNNEKRMKK